MSLQIRGGLQHLKNLHGLKTGRAFSDMLKQQCSLWHGTAGPGICAAVPGKERQDNMQGSGRHGAVP